MPTIQVARVVHGAGPSGVEDTSTSDLISYELEDGVATSDAVQRQGHHAVSPEVITAFHQALDQAEADRRGHHRGQPGILSGGYDLKVMQSGVENAIDLVSCRLGPWDVVPSLPDRSWPARGTPSLRAFILSA